MARFGRKTILLLLLAICLLAVALRYPLVEHQRQNDTYQLQILADSVRENHRALWVFSPLSYFGYYPASYPSGVPFVLVDASDLTGLSVDQVILILDVFIAILMALGVFILARLFIKQSEYAVLAAFLATVAPRFVDTSYWSASARSPFVALAVIAVFLAFKAGHTGRYYLYGLFVLSLVGCIALHHMGVLFLLFGFVYILSVAGAFLVSRARSSRSVGGHSRKIAAAYLLAICATITVATVFFLGYFARELDYTFGESPLFDFEPKWLSMFAAIAASYTNQIGFVLPLALFGLPLLLAKSRVATEMLFIMILPVAFIPMLPNAQYSTMLLAPFVAVLGAAVLVKLSRSRRKRMFVLLLGGLVCVSLVLPYWSIARWNLSTDLSGDPVIVDNQYFNDGAYLSQFKGRVLLISNVDLMSLRLSTISGTLFIGSGVEATLIGDINASTIKGNVTWADEKFPRNLYSWFESPQAPAVQMNVLGFMLTGMAYIGGPGERTDSGEFYFDIHSKLIVAIDDDWPSNYVWMWGNYAANLPAQLRSAEWSSGSTVRSLPCYLIYGSEVTSLFLLEVPR